MQELQAWQSFLLVNLLLKSYLNNWWSLLKDPSLNLILIWPKSTHHLASMSCISWSMSISICLSMNHQIKKTLGTWKQSLFIYVIPCCLSYGSKCQEHHYLYLWLQVIIHALMLASDQVPLSFMELQRATCTVHIPATEFITMPCRVSSGAPHHVDGHQPQI